MSPGHSKWETRRGTCGLGQSYHIDAPACLAGVAQALKWREVLWYQQRKKFHKFAVQAPIVHPEAGSRLGMAC